MVQESEVENVRECGLDVVLMLIECLGEVPPEQHSLVGSTQEIFPGHCKLGGGVVQPSGKCQTIQALVDRLLLNNDVLLGLHQSVCFPALSRLVIKNTIIYFITWGLEQGTIWEIIQTML